MEFHQSLFDIDNLYSRYLWLGEFSVNDYQLFTVVWNVFLTAVPLVIYLFLKKYWRRADFSGRLKKIIAAFLFLLWLLFFPNSAYIMTDVRHLLNYCPVGSLNQVCAANAWMIIFFFSYSVFGWVSFYYLLKIMSGFVTEIFNKLWSNIFVVLTIPLAALGVLLGLINRFNSLDALLYPRALLRSAAAYFLKPDYFIDWFIYTIFLYLLYFAGDALFKKIKV